MEAIVIIVLTPIINNGILSHDTDYHRSRYTERIAKCSMVTDASLVRIIIDM